MVQIAGSTWTFLSIKPSAMPNVVSALTGRNQFGQIIRRVKERNEERTPSALFALACRQGWPVPTIASNPASSSCDEEIQEYPRAHDADSVVLFQIEQV